MPLDLATLVTPTETALITQECQRGVIGDLSALPELADNASEVLPNIVQLVRVARQAGCSVIHCTAERRRDGLGANLNARIFQYMARAENPLVRGSGAAEIVPEIEIAASDILLPRLHGLSPFQGTELDSLLRNLGVRSIIAVGVSVNVAIQNLAFDAVNAGYQVVIPRDAVAGYPKEYCEDVFAHTLGAVATLVSTGNLVATWQKGSSRAT